MSQPPHDVEKKIASPRSARFADVGIDDINLYAGPLSISSTQIAEARGFGPRELRMAQFERRSVVPALEDPVTLAVNAARPLLADHRDDIELLIVGTETGFDFAKSMSTYVHRHLGLASECRNFEVKHACFAGTAALLMAAAWATLAPGKRALVVCTDVARRHFGDPSELTAGSGAVAFTVSQEPRVFRLHAASGRATHEVYDVARPTHTSEHGDAALSLASYLDLLELAAQAYKRTAGVERLTESLDYFVFHAPLVSLVEQAYAALLDSDGCDVSADEARRRFMAHVDPGLLHNRQVANLYSGSVFASLIALAEKVDRLHGRRVGIYSYGSGACAELYSGELMPTAAAVVGRHGIAARLAARRPVSVADYEEAVYASEASLVGPRHEPVVSPEIADLYRTEDLLVLQRVDNHHRIYAPSASAGAAVKRGHHGVG